MKHGLAFVVSAMAGLDQSCGMRLGTAEQAGPPPAGAVAMPPGSPNALPIRQPAPPWPGKVSISPALHHAIPPGAEDQPASVQATMQFNPPVTGFYCADDAACNNHGSCDKQKGVCWCDLGFGGTDCGSEVSEGYEVNANIPGMSDMNGPYFAEKMYLVDNSQAADTRFIHYDNFSAGWAVSTLNSSCQDDICLFAYAPGLTTPPDKGYVYGAPMFHAYFRQLLFDDHEVVPGVRKGYRMTLDYTEDPQQIAMNDYAMRFNGRYVLQPRYVSANKKYSIQPVDFAWHRTWFFLAFAGEPRKWRVVMSAKDPSMNRNSPPAGPWVPGEYGFTIRPICGNHVGDAACDFLRPHCYIQSSDTPWIHQCCRSTCQMCTLPRTGCQLPKTNPLLSLAMSRTVVSPADNATHSNKTSNPSAQSAPAGRSAALRGTAGHARGGH